MTHSERVPPLKTHTLLAEDDIAGLCVITQTEFDIFVDRLYQTPCPDYKHIPNVIRLPPLRKSLADILGVQNENFLLKANATHIRPQRKSRYGQSLRIEEMKGLLDVIATAETAYIDTEAAHLNFMLVATDRRNEKMANKIVFNKDKRGNYIVTIGKIELIKLASARYIKVGAGVAPAIRRS